MKKIKFILFVFFISNCHLAVFSNNYINYNEDPRLKVNISFTENKGQVSDQNFKAQPDILFSGTDGNLVYHLKNKGISYQLNKVDTWKTKESYASKKNNDTANKEPNQITTYRLDINWLNSKTHAKIINGEALDGYNNYYLDHCPNGALNVKSYKTITYQNLYSGIDLKWYEKDGHLKYDYMVAAGSDYKLIQLEFSGAEKISINKKGELIIKTPLGTIIEKTPLVIQEGKTLIANWLINNNVVSYNIEGLNENQAYIIDPMVCTWGTYYGGNGGDYGYSCATDILGNVYLTGYTNVITGTIIATTGSHQSTIGGVGDAFTVKFDVSGTRLWGTYYGGTAGDYGNSCSTDANGNVYLAGNTQSTIGNAIATATCYQPNYGGAINDAFLVKFNSAGIRQWGTYYGGAGEDFGYSCTTDINDNVFLAGYTLSNNNIASVGSQQATFGGGVSDAFLVKFNSSGTRQWGTYYGGTLEDIGNSCFTNTNGDVYLGGTTGSNTGISSAGSHQAIYGGGANDAFLVKFNSLGVRQWGTYYGGVDLDYGRGCTTDAFGNVYLTGDTKSNSNTEIATSSSHQPIYGGGSLNAFLVKFNTAGVRQWGTYYGGTGYNYGYSCATDVNSNVYLAGQAAVGVGNVIATIGSYQPNHGGGGSYDAFLAKFNPVGVRQWGTYYGGTNDDIGFSCAIDTSGKVYLAGQTQSGTLATNNAHQPNFGGYNDAFLVQFFDCTPAQPTNTTLLLNQTICNNNTATLSAIGTGTISWFANPTGGTAIGTGTLFITPSLSAGTYTYFAETATSCTVSNIRTAITITVNPAIVPSVTLSVSPTGTICAGQFVTFTATPTNGVSNPSYQWQVNGSNVGTNSSTFTYSTSTNATIVNAILTSNATCASPTTVVSNSITLIIGSVIPSVTLSVLPSNTICAGQSLTFSATPTNGGTAPSYQWQVNGINVGTNSATFTSSNMTNASLVNVILSPNLTCISTPTAISNPLSITVKPLVTPSVVLSTLPNLIICSGQATSFTVNAINSGTLATYQWQVNGNNVGTNSATYTSSNLTNGDIVNVILTPNISCSTSSTITSASTTLSVNQSPTITLTPDVTITKGSSTILIASGGITYNWLPSVNLSCTNCYSTTANPSESTVYCVEVTGTNSCISSKCVNVIIDFICGDLFIPNVFSPNDDGLNDKFNIKINPDCVSKFKLLIFDRWGEKVFESININTSWDGTDKGLPLNVGVFVYYLNIQLTNSSSTITKKGNVSIIK